MEQIKLPITFEERTNLDGGEHRFTGIFKAFCQLLQYLIFLEQDSCLVTVYSRIGNSFRWKSTDYDNLDQTFAIGNDAILVGDLYENIEL